MLITIEIKEISRGKLVVNPRCTKSETPLERIMSEKMFAAFVATLQVERSSSAVKGCEMAVNGTAKNLGCVALEWDAYGKVYDSMPPPQRRALLQAFYAGALGMFNLTAALAELPQEEAVKRLEALRVETVAFLTLDRERVKREAAASN
jgi:hypothetical protein